MVPGIGRVGLGALLGGPLATGDLDLGASALRSGRMDPALGQRRPARRARAHFLGDVVQRACRGVIGLGRDIDHAVRQCQRLHGYVATVRLLDNREAKPIEPSTMPASKPTSAS
jgi:hypothetical protein